MGESDGTADEWTPILENRTVNASKDRDLFSFITDSLLGGEYFCFFLHRDWVLLPEDGKIGSARNGYLATFFLLLNGTLGSGILFQAYAVSKVGYILALFMYPLLGSLTYLGVYLLIRAAECNNIFTFVELGEAAAGKYGKYLIEMSIIISTTGSLISYISVIGDMVEGVVSTYMDDVPWFLDENLISIIAVFILVIPLCLARRFSHLGVIAYIAQIFTCCFLGLVLIGGPLENARSGTLLQASGLGLMQNIGTLVFAASGTMTVFHTYKGVDSSIVSPGGFQHIAIAFSTVSVVILASVGIVGYISFGDSTDLDIVNNFSSTVGTIFRLMIATHVLFFVPGEFIIMRASLYSVAGLDVEKQENFSYVTLTVSIFVFVTAIACVLNTYVPTNGLALVLNLAGACTGLYTFSAPGLIALNLLGANSDFFYYTGSFLMWFGYASALAVVVSSIAWY